MTIDTTKAFTYGFAAFAVYFAYKSTTGAANTAGGGIFDMLTGQRKASGAAVPQNTQKISEVLDGNGGAFSNGWRYFSDGTSISPAGDYYSGNTKIWSPT